MPKLTDSAVGPIPVFPGKVEIKKLTKSFGHEGPSYNCEVWINGKKACLATEEGSGGGVMLHWFDKQLEKLVDDYAASMPRNDLFDPKARKEHEKKCQKFQAAFNAKTPEEREAWEAKSREFLTLKEALYNAPRAEQPAIQERIKLLKAETPEGLEAPDPNYMYHTMHQDDVVDEWVNDWIEDADMRRRCKNAICYRTKDQSKDQYYVVKVPFTAAEVKRIQDKYPDAEIFNFKYGKPLADAEAPTETMLLSSEQIAEANAILKDIRALHRASQPPSNPLLKKGWKPLPFEEQHAKEQEVWGRLMKLQEALGQGFRVGKLLSFSVADGKAHYMVLKIGKQLTELAWLPFGDAWQAEAVEVVEKATRGKRRQIHQCLTSVAKRQALACEGLRALFAGAKA